MKTETYLYVSQAEAETISVLKLSYSSGTLSMVQDVPVGGKVMPMTMSPNKQFLYAGLRSVPDYKIVSFAVDGGGGKLHKIGETPAFNSVVYLATDRSGKYLIVSNNPHNYDHRTGVLAISAIGSNGAVQAPYEIYRTPPKLHSAMADPSNRFILGASCDGNAMLRYQFDGATGRINPEALASVPIERGRGPRHFLFHPNNRYLYLVNEYEASVYVFRYDVEHGRLFEVQIADAKPDGFEPQERGRLGISAAAADLHFTPDARWLYVSVRGSSTMAIFAVDPSTGLLESRDHAKMPLEPRGFCIDPLGQYLICAGDKVGKLVVYRIDTQTGALSQVSDYQTGGGPNWIEAVRLP